MRAVDRREPAWYAGIAARGWSETPEVVPFREGFARSGVEVARHGFQVAYTRTKWRLE